MTVLHREDAIRGLVFDIQRMCVHDGPGIRTTVFLKGCALRCAWCHNPEGMSPRPQLAFTPALCVGCGLCVATCPRGAHIAENGRRQFIREKCVECFACARQCYANALEEVGQERSVAEVLDEVAKDKPFFDESNGGMTLSGGEPLVQFSFAFHLLAGARARGIHSCLETSGAVPVGHVAAVASVVDLVLFDYKETDSERHRAVTGQGNEVILKNLKTFDDNGVPIVLRCPIIPELNLRENHLRGIAAVAEGLRHCVAIHLLPYHPLGESKRTRLGIAGRQFRELTEEETAWAVDFLRSEGGCRVVVV